MSDSNSSDISNSAYSNGNNNCSNGNFNGKNTRSNSKNSGSTGSQVSQKQPCLFL